MVLRLVSLQTLKDLQNYSDHLGYNLDLTQKLLVLCKIKFYISTVTAILPPSFIVLACLDRLMLSSLSARARRWSKPKVAYRLVAGVSLVWVVLSVHALVGSTVYSGPGYSYCYIQQGSYTLFIALYSIIIMYLSPAILMSILGVLTIINVRRAQRQIHPFASPGSIKRKDRHLLHMLLFQVVVSVIFTIPGAAFQVKKNFHSIS